MVKAVEARLAPWQEQSYPASESISTRDFTAEYCAYVRTKIDLDRIRSAGLTIVHDAMHGSGMSLYTALLGKEHVVEHRSTVNPSFGGIAPEPIEKNLTELPGLVRSHGASAGIANDGDADRIGMVDERGNFVDSHRILALLVDYLHTDRGASGTIVKTFSTTDMLDKMGAAMGLPVETTAIGFKYIGEKILEGNVLVGGEESGGMAVLGHIPERDGIFIGMLILEMMAVRGKSLGELVDDLFRRYGAHAYWRVDAHTTASGKQRILDMLQNEGGLREVGGATVRSMSDLDGYKHRMDDGWLLIRPSGTEPVLRVYAEAPTETDARKLVEDALRQLGVDNVA
jgi:phosphomannomutase